MRAPSRLLPRLVGMACAACAAQGTTGDTSSTPPGSFTLTLGPLTIPAGTERTQCIVQRLGNAAAIHVGTVQSLLGPASHHMIVYRVSDDVERTTPFDCAPFTDMLDPTKGTPLFFAQREDDTLTLPKGVGFALDPKQMLRIEVHARNDTVHDLTLTASTTLSPIAESEVTAAAGFLFLGNPDVTLPPRAATTLGPSFFPLPADYDGARFFALTAHEHALGTGVQVSTAFSVEDPGQSVYAVPDWSWRDPATVYADPPFTVPKDGGFRFSCSWNNPTSNTVLFGEDAGAEMCFVGAYYYPDRGARVCLHSDAPPAPSDYCCPGDGRCYLVP